MSPCCFTLRGEYDLANADELLASLRGSIEQRPDASTVLVDCAELVFIDMAGLRPLLMVQAELARQDRDFRSVNVPEAVARILRITELTHLVHPDGHDRDFDRSS